LVFAMRLFTPVPVHGLKCTDSINVPVAPDDLSIGSTDGSADNHFRRRSA
jgi:hypothetical protein